MIPQKIKYYKNWLQQENYKSFYLSLLRVAISLWLLKEVCFNWSSMDILYGESVYVMPKNTIINRLPGGVSFVREYFMWFIIPYIAIILLNILGIGRWFTALLLFSMVYVLQQMNMYFLNGGDKLAKLILLYLIFANSYEYFVLFKQKYIDPEKKKFLNLVSNLAAFSIMLQLCLSYFLSGLGKINNPVWWQGEATYYALSMERFLGTPLNKYIVEYKWINILSNYAVIAFELLFPFLVWIKKIRKPLLVAGLLFHLCIYVFLMIYGFQIVFILTYGLFLPNTTWKKIFSRVYRM